MLTHAYLNIVYTLHCKYTHIWWMKHGGVWLFVHMAICLCRKFFCSSHVSWRVWRTQRVPSSTDISTCWRWELHWNHPTSSRILFYSMSVLLVCSLTNMSLIFCELFFTFLQNLAWVKSYNICFELEDCNEIFIQLFKTLFSVIK